MGAEVGARCVAHTVWWKQRGVAKDKVIPERQLCARELIRKGCAGWRSSSGWELSRQSGNPGAMVREILLAWAIHSDPYKWRFKRYDCHRCKADL